MYNSYHYTVHMMPILDQSAFLMELLTVCKCGFDTEAPVEHTKWMTLTWDCTLGHGCVHWASRPTIWTALVSVSSLWSFSGQFLTCCCHLPPQSPAHTPFTRPPLSYAGSKLVCTFKNDLKWHKIKQATNSMLKFNSLISTVLLNKASLTRAKAG